MVSKPRILLNEQEIRQQAAQSSDVRNALRDKADRMLPRAQREALKAGAIEFARALRVETGTRPGTKSPTGFKRPFARVIADNDGASDTEHGNVGVPKQAILRRVMRA